ncbi:MAG: lysylphosphatidylglycerol synthase transmembrane domain-containing protein [Pseudomonadota bacterium]
MTKPTDGRGHWDKILMFGLLGCVIFGLVALASATGWQETLAQLGKLSVASVTGLLALSLANYGMRALRWHLFVRQLGLDTSISVNTRHYMGGFAMTVTPGRIGELIRMRWLNRETGWSYERTAPLALMDRAADLAAMGLLLALSVALSTGGLTLGLPVAVAAVCASVIATRPALLSALVGWGYRVTGLFPRFMARCRAAARSLASFSSPSLILSAGTLSILGWLAEGWAFYLLLVWMGADVPLWTAVAIFLFATLAGGLTGAPGGLGGAEAAMVALLSLEGVPLDISVAATAVIRLTTLWFAIAIGLIVFPFAERHSKQARDTA